MHEGSLQARVCAVQNLTSGEVLPSQLQSRARLREDAPGWSLTAHACVHAYRRAFGRGCRPVILSKTSTFRLYE